MQYINGFSDYKYEGPAAVTLGKFDGVHLAHQELIKSVVNAAGERGTVSVVVSFDMAPQSLLTWEEKAELLNRMGVDFLIRVPFRAELITTPAPDFVEKYLAGTLHASFVSVGSDFRFGYHRAGDAAFLEEQGGKYGFQTRIIPPFLCRGRKIGSTWIREALEKGDMETVKELLGYPYALTGEIVHGRELGRTLGVPTANIIPSPEKLLPPFGVYMTRTWIGGTHYNGITNIGSKPTVDGRFVGAETYLLHVNEDLYGCFQKIELLKFSRPEIKFSSVEELKIQLRKDVAAGEAYFS